MNWTNITAKPPQDKSPVLMCFADGTVASGFIWNGRWYAYYDLDKFSICGTIPKYWMPRPTPPRWMPKKEKL